MDSSDEEFFISPNTYNILFAKEKLFGAHPINRKRKEFGEFHNLYGELRNYPDKFYAYTRMSIDTFDYILNKIELKLTKHWTNFIKTPILPCEQLIVTLR